MLHKVMLGGLEALHASAGQPEVDINSKRTM